LLELNVDFFGMGCSSHILHNSASSATSKMYKDVEALANSIANHFSNSLARMDLLTDLADELPVFCEIQFMINL
jgi:hypothetical protein